MTTPTTGRAPTGAASTTAHPAVLVASRVLHAVLLLAVLVALVLEVRQALTIDPAAGITRTERLVRLFSYFTIQSNIVVALASGLVLLAPLARGRWRAVVRLDALLCIAVTGVVYHALLSDDAATLAPAGQWSNFLLHTFTPIGAWVVWLLVGPRPRFRWSTVGWAVAYPLAWIAYTFVRGSITGWYPYPFLDVTSIGLGAALLNTAGIALGFLALAALVRLLERVLPAAPHGAGRAGGEG
jgi:hypothetical protein